MKKNLENLKFPLKGKYIAMVAPSFVVDFSYPSIISQLKKLGFDKVVELTFGAKMVNREYHKFLENSKELAISSVCPGIVDIVKNRYPQFKENLIPVDSPMIAMAKICRKTYPGYKTVFLSPCNFKKSEASDSKIVDYAIDYKELKELFSKYNINPKKEKVYFDKFYNDYTKIYPLAGGLSKTAHLKGVLKKNEVKIIDGIGEVAKFLEKPDKSIKFLDVNFCVGGCIGGPCINSKDSLKKRKKRVLSYLRLSNEEDIPNTRLGLVERAKDINFNIKKF
ncbi:MAG: [Fe-Fe] hydrogenase large subunit C-terminal domain-containing protein [Nanoarchaeota archaeon]